MEASEHFTRFRQQLVQRTGSYQMYRCFFTSTEGNFPSKAWLKVYPSPSEESSRELCMLQTFSEYQECFSVVRYLYHCFSRQKVYIFIEWFDNMLELEIQKRAKEHRYWSENELWKHLKALAKAVFQLHAIRVVHRNITPDTVFIQGEKLVLGHFEDSKQIAENTSMQLQTIRGTEMYFTPQNYRAEKTREPTTYEASLGDDIWSLGRLFLDMASLDCNSNVLRFYSRPQSALDSYIASKLRTHYSPAFISILCKIMTIDASRRPKADDLLNLLQDVDPGHSCSNCHSTNTQSVLNCGHSYCEKCVLSLLLERIHSLSPLTCHCGHPFPSQELAVYGENYQRLGELVEQPELDCPGKCGAKYPRLKWTSSPLPTSTLQSCAACGLVYCSYCGVLNGHRFLGISKVCTNLPSFQ